jgi:hypothetical protein
MGVEGRMVDDPNEKAYHRKLETVSKRLESTRTKMERLWAEYQQTRKYVDELQVTQDALLRMHPATPLDVRIVPESDLPVIKVARPRKARRR